MSDQAHREEVQARWEQVRHSDRAAVDIGITLLKSAILVNAGSLVALLALSGQLWKEDRQTAMNVLINAHAFVYGLGFAVIGAIVAYVYQSLVTRREVLILDQMNKRGEGPSNRLKWAKRSAATIMVLITVSSYGAFLFGAIYIANALQN
ncbi:MAG TPA: hypothetical protein VFC38_07915 [Stellaceae bacterium]|nr:hypothetical protein [Stellaceae bacterium]